MAAGAGQAGDEAGHADAPSSRPYQGQLFAALQQALTAAGGQLAAGSSDGLGSGSGLAAQLLPFCHKAFCESMARYRRTLAAGVF